MKKTTPARAAAASPVMKGGMPRAVGVRIRSLTRKRVIGEMRIKPLHLNETGMRPVPAYRRVDGAQRNPPNAASGVSSKGGET